jgi:hypothetical protein
MSCAPVLFLGLVACSGSDKPEQRAAPGDKALTKAVHAPLDRAKAVEEQMKKDAEARAREIDEKTAE